MGKEADKGLKDFKVGAIQVLRLIPDEELAKLAATTKVDYCAKVLTGERMFYLLVYAFVKSDRISQRKLEDYFQLKPFQQLFNFVEGQKVRHSSISARLANIDLSFFEKSFELIYNELSKEYTEEEIAGYNLVRVDSSMVSEACNKLKNGMVVGRKTADGGERKQIKYTVAFDGFSSLLAEVLTEQTDLCENVAMPKVVLPLIKKDVNHKNLYILDRGFSSLENYDRMLLEKGKFVGRLCLGRRMETIRVVSTEPKDFGQLEMVEDKWVHLYDNKEKQFSKTVYRVIHCKFKTPRDTSRKQGGKNVKKLENEICFITNNFDISAEDVVFAYKKRWDIEVFFRFLKQQLCFSHFLSTSKNGIKVILYMTLITAMLILIYKKKNETGYARAKWCFAIELETWMLVYTRYVAGLDYEHYNDKVRFRTHIPAD